MSAKIEMLNKKFNALAVLNTDSLDSNGALKWLCQCICGNKIVVCGTLLRNGRKKNCGCMPRNQKGENGPYYKHGHSPRSGSTKVYIAWQSMLRRCDNKNLKYYDNYSGRGITVCKRWHTFKNFLKDIGNPPTPKHTLDRINNDGNYEPGNCRWATPKEQANNRRLPMRGKKRRALWNRH